MPSITRKKGLEYLIPLQDERFELWTQSLHFGAASRSNTVHEETNLKVGGGLDDVWLNTETGQVHLVDYKRTSQKSPNKAITLDYWWKASPSEKNGSCACVSASECQPTTPWKRLVSPSQSPVNASAKSRRKRCESYGTLATARSFGLS